MLNSFGFFPLHSGDAFFGMLPLVLPHSSEIMSLIEVRERLYGNTFYFPNVASQREELFLCRIQ